MKQEQTIHMLSLGCPKNRVDSEVMLGHMLAEGYRPVDTPEAADVVVVNTCGFIDAAKEESVEAIIEMEELKKEGSVQTLVVAGCLSQRYAPELAKELPQVDHFLGTGNFHTIAQVLKGAMPSEMPKPQGLLTIVDDHPRLRGKNKLVPFRHDEQVGERNIHIPDPDFQLGAASPRVASLPGYMSYVKVSEGCSNTCAFCIIPKLRGPQRSRNIADIIQEVEALRLKGTTEFNLIAQDLCAFGNDRKGDKENLAGLLRAFHDVGERTDGPMWVRSLYAYPKGLTTEVMDVMADSPHILPYLDMPLQHISDKILRNMKRGKGGSSTLELLRKLRSRIPNLTLRTTFITGLPGETDEDFAELCDVVKEIRFERMGVFVYSPEEDTPAATMENQIERHVAQERKDHLMSIQREISEEQQMGWIGKKIQVLVEGVSEETELLLQGRHAGQAPDIDGITYINDGMAYPGDLVTVEIEETTDYDLVGGIV